MDVERTKPMTSETPDSVPEDPETPVEARIPAEYGASEIQVLEGLEAVRSAAPTSPLARRSTSRRP